MASDATREEMLVFSDSEGNYYAIPRETVELHKVSNEQKAQLQSLMGAEVSGYSMHEQFMAQQYMQMHQSELLQEAAEARRAKEARTQAPKGADDQKDRPQAQAERSLKGAFVGMWITLTGAR